MSQIIADADVLIDLAEQTLTLPKNNKFYLISSGKMALAKLKIVVKRREVGIWLLRSMVLSNPKCRFIARKPTGESIRHRFSQQFPERDWILSRILWLSGLEEVSIAGRLRYLSTLYLYSWNTR